MDRVFDARFGVPGFWTIGICSACGLEQTFPLLDLSALRALYEAHYNFGGEKDTLYDRLRERFLGSAAYAMWLRLDGDVSFHGRRGQGRLLDVGCNEGRSLLRYRAGGFTAEGVEINAMAAARARAAGFRVHEGTIEDFRPTQLYDVVVLSNVLEHALDPRDMLRRVRSVLAPGGQLWVSLPNGRSWLRALFGRAWINWHVPFHIVHFSEATLGKLLREEGFAVESTNCTTPAVWVCQSLLAAVFGRPSRPTLALRNPALVGGVMAAIRGLFFPVLWAGDVTGRGDCLVVTARKDARSAV
ncbi:MAG TPA: class I SAM-dependent methyltransferase [Polyangia bacterium]|nr:class I SAM-dependent methyltransferase [Polyangia bacterium]